MSAVFSAMLAVAAAVSSPVPFDLTYMPRTSDSVLAVRPGALAKQLGGEDKTAAEMVQRTLAAAFAFIDGDLKAAPPPALADVEQVILSAKLTLSVEQQQNGQSALNLNGISSGLVRTAKPFDWAKCVKKWFPKAEAVKHAGREYLRVPITFGKDTSYLGLFVADTHTLAFDTNEGEIKGLLTRLDKKLTPATPAGWDEVKCDTVALCQDTAADGWLAAPEKPKREIDQTLVTAARKSTGLAVGFTAGARTTLRVIAATRNEADAKEVRAAVKVMLANLAADEDTDPLAAKLIAGLTVTRDGATVRAEGSVAGNLLRRLLESQTGD